MIRILHVLGRTDRGGAETMIMNVYRNIDRSKVQFDFVIHTDDVCDFDDEILSLGGQIFHLPRFRGKNYFAYKKAWKQLLLCHPEWKIIHGHVRSTASIYLKIAHKLGRITIAHSHSISSGSGFSAFVKNVLQYPIRFVSDYFLACSDIAGEWLFGKKVCAGDKYFTFHNAIQLNDFTYNAKVREELRRKLCLDGKFVVGHVGRFEPPKNHSFLLDVFNCIAKKRDDAVLVLVGTGSLVENIKQKAQSLGLSDKVIFLGLRNDANMLLQAFDFFLFPSAFEGLGIALVEAQAAGLHALTSDKVVPKEAQVTDLLCYLPLDASPEIWAEKVLSYADGYERCDTSKEIAKKGYDIKQSAKWLSDFYLKILN